MWMVDFYKTIHIVDKECLDVWAYQSKEKNIEKDFTFFLIEIIYQYIIYTIRFFCNKTYNHISEICKTEWPYLH